MALSDKQKLKFYRKPKLAERTLLANAKKRGHIIFGARAVNKFLPPYLDKHTEDYDIYSKTPHKTAHRVENKMDKRYGGDLFFVKKGMNEGTFRIMSNVTNREVVDYTIRPDKVQHKTIGGLKYATLNHQKKKIRESLNNPEAFFRHAKDRETLQRIKLFEKTKRK